MLLLLILEVCLAELHQECCQVEVLLTVVTLDINLWQVSEEHPKNVDSWGFRDPVFSNIDHALAADDLESPLNALPHALVLVVHESSDKQALQVLKIVDFS